MTRVLCQSARLPPYLSWKLEIRRDWYRSQIGRDLWAKAKTCTPVHGLSGLNKQKVRVPECTFSLLPLNLAEFGFCTVPISSDFDFPA